MTLATFPVRCQGITGRKKKGARISDLAGSWKMTDEEAEEMLAAIDESWKKWRLSDSAPEQSQETSKGKSAQKNRAGHSISTKP